MPRPIDADMLMEQVKAVHKAVNTADINQSYGTGFHSATSQMQGLIAYMPTLSYKDLAPQGEWTDCRGGDATCSRCGIRQKAVYDDDNEQHFCGHCGARMRGGNE